MIEICFSYAKEIVVGLLEGKITRGIFEVKMMIRFKGIFCVYFWKKYIEIRVSFLLLYSCESYLKESYIIISIKLTYGLCG